VHVEVNGTRLWFDVEGPALVPDASRMVQRPTVVLLHGGPGSWDHSYLKPHFGRLADVAQVIYLDLRDHGRSGRTDPELWSYELCADDIAAFCVALGIDSPIVAGHSMGGFVALHYGVRHPNRLAGLILLSTSGRFDLAEIGDGFRAAAGDEVAALAVRDYAGDAVTPEEWALVFRAFGPNLPGPEERARTLVNRAVNRRGMELMRRHDVLAELGAITCPTLVCVGELDPVTPVSAARRIVGALPPAKARLAIIAGAGHFPWMDAPDALWPILERFIEPIADKQSRG
jgi:pimeloyl-ACP methyl ester carboxylesterase